MMAEAKKSPAYVLLYAAVVSTLFTAGIMALHAATRDVVERNERLFEQKAIVELFGLGDVETLSDTEIVDLYEKRTTRFEDIVDPLTGEKHDVYWAVDENGEVIGLAFPVSGTGFWGRIDGYVAVTPDLFLSETIARWDGEVAFPPEVKNLSKIIGITFLKHQETPGLGGRITERDWRRKFVGLDITPNPGGQFIYIGGEIPQAGSPRTGRHVDAISGATGTTRALERFLNEQIPVFYRLMDEVAIRIIKEPY